MAIFVKISRKRRFGKTALLFVLLSGIFSCDVVIHLIGELGPVQEGYFPLYGTPAGLAVNSTGPGSVVQLRWDSYSIGVDGYRIYMDYTANVTTKSTLVAVSTTNSATIPVVAGVNYYFAVSAYQEKNESPLSSVISYRIVCGNGFIEEGETCDDGNLIYGDGCSPICQIEGGDTQPPELTALFISGAPGGAGGNYRAGEQVTISWSETDDISGYAGADLYLLTDGGETILYQKEGLDSTVHAHSITLGEVVHTQNYFPAVVLRDFAGNEIGYYYNSASDSVFLMKIDIYTEPPQEILPATNVPAVHLTLEGIAWPPAGAVVLAPDATLAPGANIAFSGGTLWYSISVSAGNTYGVYLLDANNSAWATGRDSLSLYFSDATTIAEGLFHYHAPYFITSTVNDIVYIQVRDQEGGGTFGLAATEHFGNGICGNGVLNVDESCDDGNIVAGDGCSSFCRREPLVALVGDLSLVNINAGESAKITLKTHPLVRDVRVGWFQAPDRLISEPLFSTSPGDWSFTYPGGDYLANGYWELVSIHINDLSYTRFEYSRSGATYGVSHWGSPLASTGFGIIGLDILGSNPDTQPPVLVSLLISDGVYQFRDMVSITAEISDDRAGISTLFLSLEDGNRVSYGDGLLYPDGTGKYFGMIRLEGGVFQDREIYPDLRVYERAGNNLRFYYNPINPGVFTQNTEPFTTVEQPTQVSAVPATIGASPVTLLAMGGPWLTGSVTEYGESLLYAFDVNAGGFYQIFWDDSADGSGATSTDVALAIYYADYTPIGGVPDFLDSGFTTPFAFSAAVTGRVYIEVRSRSGSGQFKIRVQ